MIRVWYHSNNSGGDWWLSDEDWHALEAAGWKVQWVRDDPGFRVLDDEGRWLGALACDAYKDGEDLAVLISEWEKVTGKSSAEPGCSCCGPPHFFQVQEMFS